MAKAIPSSSSHVELSRINHSAPTIPDRLSSHNEFDSEEAPATAAQSSELTKPTKKYQTMLLLSGFLMTFHVIGINQSYGIFQASSVYLLPSL
jgi:hypothetical protein